MFRKFSEWAMAYAIKLGYIKEEEQEEYIYGLDLIMSSYMYRYSNDHNRYNNENDTTSYCFRVYVQVYP